MNDYESENVWRFDNVVDSTLETSDLEDLIAGQEGKVIGRCITDADFSATVSTETFTDSVYRDLHKIMQAARSNGITVNREVLNELATEKYGADHYVVLFDIIYGWNTTVPTEDADVCYERMVDRCTKQQAAKIGLALSQSGNAEAAIARLQMLHKSDRSYIDTPKDLAQKSLNMITAGIKPSIKTGFAKIDQTFGGFHPSDLIVCAARPGVGKTALATNMAWQSKEPTLFCSLEQPRHQIGLRLISAIGDVDGDAIRNDRMTDAQREQCLIAADRLGNSGMHVWDKPNATVNDIVREAKRCYAEHNIKAVFVDYLGRIKGGEGSHKHEVVGDNIRALKNLALTLNIPVIVLVQLNRQVDSRDELFLSDLKDSGDIEAEADMVFLMKRASEADTQAKDFNAHINVAKNRHGRCGTFELEFESRFARFRDVQPAQVIPFN